MCIVIIYQRRAPYFIGYGGVSHFAHFIYNKLVLLISAGTFLFSAVPAWMNYKPRCEISRAVEDHFNKQINTLLGKHLQELQLELEIKADDFEKRKEDCYG